MNCTFALAYLLAGFGRGEGGLDAYVNRDLTKLRKVEAKQFQDRLQAIMNEKPDRSAWQIPTARWIKKYRIGESEWMLLMLSEAMSIPGSGTVKVYGFTHNWRPTYTALFNTGYRLSPTKVELVEPHGFSQPVLRIHVESLGPFVVTEGEQAKPAFHPESGMDLYCAFNDQGGSLIRLTRGDGKLIGNSFQGGFPAYGGPAMPVRPSRAWKADLSSADPVRQLSAIMWLSSSHLNSKDWRKRGFARESVKSSLSFEELRSDAAIAQRLEALRKSPNPWLSEQSAFALENLARPLAPVEDPPNWGGGAQTDGRQDEG